MQSPVYSLSNALVVACQAVLLLGRLDDQFHQRLLRGGVKLLFDVAEVILEGGHLGGCVDVAGGCIIFLFSFCNINLLASLQTVLSVSAATAHRSLWVRCTYSSSNAPPNFLAQQGNAINRLLFMLIYIISNKYYF